MSGFPLKTPISFSFSQNPRKQNLNYISPFYFLYISLSVINSLLKAGIFSDIFTPSLSTLPSKRASVFKITPFSHKLPLRSLEMKFTFFLKKKNQTTAFKLLIGRASTNVMIMKLSVPHRQRTLAIVLILAKPFTTLLIDAQRLF